MRTVASIIIEMLRDAGMDRVFGVSGESYLAFLDELEKCQSIDVTLVKVNTSLSTILPSQRS